MFEWYKCGIFVKTATDKLSSVLYAFLSIGIDTKAPSLRNQVVKK